MAESEAFKYNWNGNKEEKLAKWFMSFKEGCGYSASMMIALLKGGKI